MGLAASKQEAFWEACGYGHTNRVRRFIDEGIDVNWVSYTVSFSIYSVNHGVQLHLLPPDHENGDQ